MDEGQTDLKSFWDLNVASFRQTVLLAIRETSDALRSPAISPGWRMELESQLEELIQYIGLANRYMARRSLSFALDPEPPSVRLRVH